MSGYPYQAYPGAYGSSQNQPPYPPTTRPQFANSPFQSQPPANPSGYSSPAPQGQHQQYQQYPQQTQQTQYGQSGAYNRPPPPPPQQLTPGGYSSPAPTTQYGQSQPPYGQPPSYGQNQQSYGQSQQYGQSQPFGQNQPYGNSQAPTGYPGAGYGQQQPQGQGGYPPQGAPQQGGYPPQQQQYGQPPQQQQQYGGGPQQPSQPAGPAEVAAYKQSLQQTIQEKGLSAFYPPNSPALDQIAQRAAMQVDRLCQTWHINKEIGNDIVKLALYDIVIYVDDSGSMQFEEKGERIKDLQLILERVAFAATLFDDDGIEIRFMNQNPPEHVISGIRSDQQIQQLINGHKFSGLTPMGTELRKKVIDGIVLNKLRSNQLRKPVLIIAITDGQPAGEPTDAVFDTVRYAVNEVSRSPFGPGAIAFQFAQVGNDEKAREFLGKLDADPVVGRIVDCTSNYENESAEMARANPPVDLTPDLWIIKLLLGAIDPSYDTKDEKSNAAPGGYGAPPPGQYGGPPQGQYGAPQGGPQGGYGAPPQGGQYGRPPTGPPGYGQQQQQQQQGGYGQQQGGYGAPPAPPRY